MRDVSAARRSLLVGAALFSLCTNLRAESIEILCGDFTLVGSSARQTLVVERRRADQFVGQVKEGLSIESSDPKVVTIKDGEAHPVGDGVATITATAGELKAQVKATVQDANKTFPWSFRNHVQSVLAKGGCNSGACHGAAAGKNGFRLSLRGYDAEGDYHVLTRQSRGRRVHLADPGRSLLLTKPTGLLSHGGGKRFDVGSLEYQVLADWIADGARPPEDKDPRIERLEIRPAVSVQKPHAEQQLLVRAHFSDGRVEDVTRWAKFTATNAEVAQVDDLGKVTLIGHGEGAVTAWYLNKLVVATVSVPYEPAPPKEVFANAPRRNFIDELVLEKLEALQLPPSPRCSDGDFLRRAYLDTIGVLPTVEETRAFLADKSSDKRDRLIASLMERPEYVDYWSYKLSDLLLVNSEKLPAPAMWAYYRWIRDQVAANAPWDQTVRRLVTATGATLENGAANFFVLHQDPLELTEAISQAFLGMSINCARCHNHPLEKWTNDQYYGMVSLVSRVRLKDLSSAGNVAVYEAPEGEVVQPLTGTARPPQPLDGKALDGEALAGDSSSGRRAHLAEWLVSPENPYFARAIANRIWANFLGVGLVEKVDDLRFTNPASNEKLLSALAAHLVEKGFDLKALARTILESETYQRSSQTLPGNAADRRFYSRFYPRRLMAEVMIDAISQVTGVPTKFVNYPEGWRALQLPDSKVASSFLDRFGRPDRVIVCECERTNEPNMVQVLHLANGETINERLSAKENRIGRRLAEKASVDQIIEELYLAALCRVPTDAEKASLAELQKEAKDASPRVLLEDVAWGLLGSKDFLFNH